MGARNINSARMKQNNKMLVLDTIRACKSISRKDLAKKIGLTSASITNIVNSFIQDGYLLETGIEESLGGRRAILLSLNPKIFYFVGVELSAKRINCVLADFQANILAETHTDINAAAGPDIIIGQMVGEIEGIIEKSGIDKASIKGIGLSTPGPCDLEKGEVVNPPNLIGWSHVPIKKIIEERTGLPVEFEKETAAAALCEYWFGSARNSKGLLLCGIYELGVGSSILIDGKVFHGFGHGAGEIGHMMVDMNGPQCGCGNFGCLEALADGRALVNAVKRKLKTEYYLCAQYEIQDIDNITLSEVLKRADRGEKLFLDEVLKCARYIGIALSNIIVTISPDTIVLTGDIPDKSEIFVEEVKKYICSRHYPLENSKINVYKSELKWNIDALGGVAMLFEGIFKDQ